MKRTWKNRIIATALGFAATAAFMLPLARAVSMADYAWTPLFMQNSVPPNILFIVDYSDGMLPAAYGTYALSYNNAASYSSNYAGTGLTGTVSDTFDSTHNYYGLFDPMRCYVPASPKGFGPPGTGAVVKSAINSTCASSSPWDGNFLNWLAMRKVDVAKKALIGGQSLSASNTDGTADTLLGEEKTGLNGSTDTCASTSKSCWRYVKFVRHDTLQGRFDTTLETADTAWYGDGASSPTGPGQATTSGTTVSGYLGSGVTTFTSTFAAGDIIRIAANAPKNVTAVTDTNHLTFGPSSFSPDISNSSTYTRFFAKTGVTYPGSVTVTSGSAAVTGSSSTTNTTFNTSFSTGSVDAIQIRTNNNNNDPIQLVSSIASATSLTAAATFGTLSAAPYTIYKPSGASAPGTVSLSGTAVTGSAVTSATTFSSTFVTGDAIIANPGTGAEAQNVSAIGSASGLTTSLAFSSSVPAGTTYTLKTHGPGTSASFTNNSTSVTGSGATTFSTTFSPGDLMRIGSTSQIIALTSSATAATLANKATASLTGVYTPYRAPTATAGAGTVAVAASGTITGTGTAFTTLFQLGDLMKIGTQVEQVNTLTSATSMKTNVDFPTIGAGAAYYTFYAAGTVQVTAGGNTVTGTGTSFTTTLTPGDMILIAGTTTGQYATVSKITSNTSLTTTTNFASSASGVHYTPFTQSSNTTGPGTVSSTSTSVTGSSGTVATTFTSTFAAGDAIKVGTEVQIVCSVTTDFLLTTCNGFTASTSGNSYSKLVSSGVSGAGTGPATASTSGSTVTGVATVSSTLFTSTFVVGDIIKVTATSEPQVILSITDNTHLTTDTNFATSSTGSAYSAFSSDPTTQPGTVTTASTTAVGSTAVTQTTFLTTFANGDQITIGGQTRTIASRTDNFTMTVTVAFSPDITSPSSYYNGASSLTAPGTVSTTAASANVTGVGTNFTSRLKVGESIRVGTETKIIATITDDTHLTTTANFTSTNAAAAYFGPNGVYFGLGEADIFVNGDSSSVPFDAGSSRKYHVQVDIKPVSGDSNQTSAYQQTQSLGFIQTFRTDGMRAAVMFVNASSGKAGAIQQYFEGNFNSSDITNIRNQHITQWAPLAEATYEGLCYYRNSQGACYNNSPADWTSSVAAAGDPFYFSSSGQSVNCCKSFILMISAGIPSSDGNAPDQQTPFSGMFSGTDSIGLSDGSNSWLDNVAYYGNTHDVRDQTTPAAAVVSGTQNVVFYSVNAMGGASGAALLASASKYGGFTDQNGDSLPDSSGQTCTYPSGSNLGTGTFVSSAEWDTDKDCVPDTFFDASEGGDLTTKINDAIASILKRAASGTSVSVLATSSTGEGAIYQAYFLPETAKNDGTSDVIKWLGYTQGLFIDTFGNIREDSDGDGRLVLSTDKIITLSFDSSTSSVVVLRCPDADGDGKADTTTVGTGQCASVSLSDIKPIWEAGKRLAYLDPGTSCTTALAGSSCRRILTWLDTNNSKTVDSGEFVEFTVANMASICPFLGGTNVATCSTSSSAGQTEATNLINFHRGSDGTALCQSGVCLRDRSSKVFDPDNLNDTTGAQKVWKMGDVVDATPTVVGSPRERFDTIYGDTTYTTYYNQYKTRRQVAYIGANDGMMHAVNAGFFTAGDDSTTSAVEHGYFVTTPPSTVTSYTTARSSNPKLGAELWAFIPQALLPHLKWYADVNYTHVAYVDLKPKVTDVRIFCGDGSAAPNGSPTTCITGQPGTSTHPGGWGTILIGGMRYGGSCGACSSGTNNGGPPMAFTAKFDGTNSTTRTFYATYFVLDITDPEQDPVLLWSFTDARLGLTMSYPAALRVSPTGDSKTDPTNARWLAVFGTGATSYTGTSAQTSQIFVVDIARGPTYNSDQTSGTLGQSSCSSSTPCVSVNTAATAENVRVFSTGDSNSFMGDMITLDSNLDFKGDVIYGGNIITNTTPAYIGKMYRLTTGASSGGTPTTISSWGFNNGSAQAPSTLLKTFTSSTAASHCLTSSCKVGPVSAAPTVSADNNGNIWVFFGTGRFLGNADKTNTDQQYFFGMKDPCANGTCTQSTTSQATTASQNNLVDVSSAVVCNPCASGTELSGVTGSTTIDTLGNTIATQNTTSTSNVDGWFTTLPTSGERNLSSATILGGTVFFTSFVPTTDICVAAGSGSLYALYYLTGTPYNQSIIGSTTSGGTTTMKRSISLGTGLPSQMAVQIGSEGSGTSGSSGSGSGCAGRVTGYIQASTGVLGSVCGKSELSAWSRMLSWRDL